MKRALGGEKGFEGEGAVAISLVTASVFDAGSCTHILGPYATAGVQTNEHHCKWRPMSRPLLGCALECAHTSAVSCASMPSRISYCGCWCHCVFVLRTPSASAPEPPCFGGKCLVLELAAAGKNSRDPLGPVCFLLAPWPRRFLRAAHTCVVPVHSGVSRPLRH